MVNDNDLDEIHRILRIDNERQSGIYAKVKGVFQGSEDKLDARQIAVRLWPPKTGPENSVYVLECLAKSYDVYKETADRFGLVVPELGSLEYGLNKKRSNK